MTAVGMTTDYDRLKDVKEFDEARIGLRGVAYTSNNDLYRSKAASWHDYVQVWRAPEASPVDEIPAAFREEVVAWDGHVTEVAERVAEMLAEGLGLHGGRLKELGCLESRLWVGVYYPYCPQPELTVGLSHHTDPGALTVLVQNEVGGLQVKHGEEWVDVKPIKGALIVNVGDFLQKANEINSLNESLQKTVNMQMGLLDRRMTMVDNRMNNLELEAKKISDIESGMEEVKNGLSMTMEMLLKGKKEQKNPKEYLNQGIPLPKPRFNSFKFPQ
ncbi:hypothetical protein RJ639_002112 [Escallonia herrerae]|uniref:Fe2OG dioxygenase domain-containing protein n=1 Tax=Escallonia herrerae TaxID=1293975 RepID=A0AA88XBK7_9ASTE|nr:hypothetical protein RJ639_002112 [Escallonia herrerae]